MSKRVVIELSLVEESAEKSNKEIVDEIFSVFSQGRLCVPWCKKVEKVFVTEKSS
jgi:hypothetical protein